MSHGFDKQAGEASGRIDVNERGEMSQSSMLSVSESASTKEVFPEAPSLCNTGAPSSHFQLNTGGIDTLEVSLYGYWSPSRWNEFRPKLEAARKRSEAGIKDGAYVTNDEGDQLTVEPTGCKKGFYCRYRLNWQGCVIAIVDNAAPSDQRLSIHVSIGSIRLMQVGRDEAWRALLQVLASFGYEHVRDVVGRVDLCVDLADESMVQVQDAMSEDRFICRSKKSKTYYDGDRLETYVRGGGPVLVRLYDKAKECRKDVMKQLCLVEYRWGKVCHEAIRVEFQLRNEALKRHFSIKTVEELFSRLGTVAQWCTEWFRITERPVDRKNKNQSRAGVAALWQEVQSKFLCWTGTALPRIRKMATMVPDFRALKQQAVGCVSSIAAHFDGMTFDELWQQIGQELGGDASETVRGKRLVLQAQARLFVDDASIPF